MLKLICKQCEKEMRGRSDKKFCCIACKNEFHQSVRVTTQLYVRKIDSILHHNHHILTILMGEKRTEMSTTTLDLELMGFNFKYFTGTFLNSRNKLYHYVYDFSWMEFSKGIIKVYKKPEITI